MILLLWTFVTMKTILTLHLLDLLTQILSMMMNGQNVSECSWVILLLLTFATTKTILTLHASHRYYLWQQMDKR